MNLENMMTCTDIVPIYDKYGTQINEVKLPQKIIPTARDRKSTRLNSSHDN